MWLNLVFAGILAVFVAMGAWRGGLATGLSVLTLGLSYVAAVVFGPALAPIADEKLQLGVLALPLAGSAAFFTAFLVLGVLSKVLCQFDPGRDGPRSPRDRFLGGSFGGARGLLIALLVSYLAMWVDALRATGGAEWMPEVGESAAAQFTGKVVEEGLVAAMGSEDPAARAAARIASRPAVAAVEAQSLVENPNLSGLRSDEMFWTYVEAGNVDAALNRGSFLRLSRDGDFRQRLGALGLIEPNAVADDTAFRDAIAGVMHEVGPRIRGLKNDPELQQLLDDPQVVAMLQNGNTMGLLTHPGFRSLVSRVTSESPAN